MHPRTAVKFAALIAAALIVCGCAAPVQRLTDADRARYKAARIDDRGPPAQNLHLLAPGGANIGLMFGLIGGAAAAGPIADARSAFGAYLEKNAISMEKIAREEFEQALRKSAKIAIVSPAEAAAPLIKVSVLQYGFSVTHLASSYVLPVMWIKCEMFDGAGKILWSASDRMLSLGNPFDSVAWDELIANPGQVEEQLRKAARHISAKIVGEL